jgi:hypothetical protein
MLFNFFSTRIVHKPNLLLSVSYSLNISKMFNIVEEFSNFLLTNNILCTYFTYKIYPHIKYNVQTYKQWALSTKIVCLYFSVLSEKNRVKLKQIIAWDSDVTTWRLRHKIIGSHCINSIYMATDSITVISMKQ